MFGLNLNFPFSSDVSKLFYLTLTWTSGTSPRDSCRGIPRQHFPNDLTPSPRDSCQGIAFLTELYFSSLQNARNARTDIFHTRLFDHKKLHDEHKAVLAVKKTSDDQLAQEKAEVARLVKELKRITELRTSEKEQLQARDHW